MANGKKPDFCTECRRRTEYELMKAVSKETIREKEYKFVYTTAICKECGQEMDIPGLLDINMKERDEQYRALEGIISMEDIKRLLDIYHIGKAPLSLALGFGEVTVARYLDGQMPSKDYSDIMKRALCSPEYMKGLLNKNKCKMGETAYKKAVKAADELEDLFRISDKMRAVIAYLFEQMQEVTPLALQKLLYFIQGIHMALFDAAFFPEDCYAWQHGPVYEKVYALFRDFKYNPIDDDRFVLFTRKKQELPNDGKKVVDLVVKSFGGYSGKALEIITHSEKPWLDARRGCGDKEPSHVVIPKEDIKEYFKEVAGKYGIDSEEHLNRYIDEKLRRA